MRPGLLVRPSLAVLLALSACAANEPWLEASEACATGQDEDCEVVLVRHFGVEIDLEDPAYGPTIEGLFLLSAWDLGDESPSWLSEVPGDRPTAKVYNMAAGTFEHTITQEGYSYARDDDTLLLAEHVAWADPLNTPLDVSLLLFGYENTGWLAQQAWDNCIWEDQNECTIWGLAATVWGADP